MSLSVMTVLGTRPEIIRLARVLPALDEAFDHTLVHTGQNYDATLSSSFFTELGLREPDVFLKTDISSVGAFMGSVMALIEKEIYRIQPDALLVLGDTNSSIAALIARRMKVTVFHMEAGNRCFDENVPEEVNRRMVDHVSDINLVYTEHARRNLLAEGLHPRRIYLTGSPLREVLDFYADEVDGSRALERAEVMPRKYFLASIHREENVDHPDRLRKILDGFEALVRRSGFPLVVSTHPRTAKQLERLEARSPGSIRFVPPFGLFDYVALQRSARCVLSDSGTISEESSILGFPAISVRDAIERPEALDTGGVILSGVDSQSIVACAELAAAEWEQGLRPAAPSDYEISNTSQRVVRLISGLTNLSKAWSGFSIPADG